MNLSTITNTQMGDDSMVVHGHASVKQYIGDHACMILVVHDTKTSIAILNLIFQRYSHWRVR